MAQFSMNANRFDPYKNFKFRIQWDGRYVAGVSKVGALKRTTEVVSDTLLMFHPQDQREKVMQKYNRKLEELGLDGGHYGPRNMI